VLSRADIGQFVQINRTESIDHIHYMRDGHLVLEEEHYDLQDWSPAEKEQRIATLTEVYDRGATFFGAFDGDVLVGLSVLGHNPVKTGVDRLNLEGLWVSYGYRGQGIGRTLVGLAAQEAQERGARSLYVSATPSRNTIRFYFALGCQHADPIDPDLYDSEPEDIHLELMLA
jgi:ribosomal protein S18 acetylase RimI-like enzyme